MRDVIKREDGHVKARSRLGSYSPDKKFLGRTPEGERKEEGLFSDPDFKLLGSRCKNKFLCYKTPSLW